jgi:group I intron endonuclease
MLSGSGSHGICGSDIILIMGAIYAITHLPTGRLYVGSAVDFDARVKSHVYRLRVGTHRNRHLQNAWSLYGADEFSFVVLEIVEDRSQLFIREQHYIDTLKPTFNIALAADNPMRGRKQSAKFIALLSAREKGTARSPEVRAKIAATLRGRKLGPRSEEVRLKLSEKLQGHAVSEETRAKISAKTKGQWHHTEETKARIGAYSREHGVRPKPQPGEGNAAARLTWADVRAIRATYVPRTYPLTRLAAEYGVDHTTISLIVRHKTWREASDDDSGLVVSAQQ